MSWKHCGRAAVAVAAIVGCIGTARLAAADWPQWRGPARDAVCRETGELTEWGPDGPPLIWKVAGLGKGYSSVAVADGRIFTMGNRRGGTFAICLREADGAELWAVPCGGGGANCTPTVDDGLVYCLTKGGDLTCHEAASGTIVWQKSFSRDFGGKMMSGWGYSESPLIDGDRLVCTPGGRDAAIVALDKKTGETIWAASIPAVGNRGNDGAGYSSIVVGEVGGIRQYIQLLGRGVVSVRADDGRYLWGYNCVANGTANIPTPIVQGEYVFCSSGYGTGAALLKMVPRDGGVDVEEVYFQPGNTMQNHHGGMVLLGDHIFFGHGHNNGFPICVEMLTGNVAWYKGRGPGSGSAAVVYVAGHLIYRYENGTVALIEASTDAYREKAVFTLQAEGRQWPHPVVANGRLYLRAEDELFCFQMFRQ